MSPAAKPSAPAPAGKGRLAECFRSLRERGRCGFIAYLTCGDPSLKVTAEAVQVLAEAGADIIELGMPFSDPIADGPVIQRASARALAAGTTTHKILEMVASLREGGVRVPFVLFGYYNPVLRYSPERLAREAVAAGADGLLVADLIPEEGAELDAVCREAGLDRTYLVAPTTADERIGLVAQATGVFLYAVSLTGVTGARESLPPVAEPFLRRIRAQTKKPVALGFGIGSPESAAAAAKLADAVVVGSAIVRTMEESAVPAEMIRRLGLFAREMVEATKQR